MKTTKVYLDLDKARRIGSVVDYKEYMAQYDAGNDKMELLKGSPLIINVDGVYIYYSDIPYLCDKCMRAFVISIHNNEQHIEYRWFQRDKKRK